MASVSGSGSSFFSSTAPTIQLLSTEPAGAGGSEVGSHGWRSGGQGVTLGRIGGCTSKEQVGLGQVQLVPKRHTGVLHARAGLELHPNLQLGVGGKGQQSPGHPTATNTTQEAMLGWGPQSTPLPSTPITKR